MKYVVIPIEKLTEAHIEHCDQDSLDTVRKSLDGKEAILSYSGSCPAVLNGYRSLSADAALRLMQTKKWQTQIALMGPPPPPSGLLTRILKLTGLRK